MSGESYSIVINDEFKELIMSLSVDELTELEKKEIEEIKTEYFEKLETNTKKRL